MIANGHHPFLHIEFRYTSLTHLEPDTIVGISACQNVSQTEIKFNITSRSKQISFLTFPSTVSASLNSLHRITSQQPS